MKKTIMKVASFLVVIAIIVVSLSFLTREDDPKKKETKTETKKEASTKTEKKESGSTTTTKKTETKEECKSTHQCCKSQCNKPVK